MLKYTKLIQLFPEVESWESYKVVNCMNELFDSTQLTVNDIDTFQKNRKSLNYLLTLPKVEQRSKEWFDLRENRLTASDLAQAMNKGKFGTRSDLLKKKAFPSSKPLEMLPPLKWGVMFEEMGMRCYQEKQNNVPIFEFGLIPNEAIPCFGASPDGITSEGIMVEMKCPYRRKFNGEIPEQYYLQIQGQLATCQLTYCDYVECYMVTFENMTDYELCIQEEDSHGIIIEYMQDNDYIYEYSPPKSTVKECQDWANDRFDKTPYTFVKLTPWKLKHMFIERVSFDPKLWESCVPMIYQFWKDVEELRKEGPPEPKPIKPQKSLTLKLDSKKEKKYTFIVDSDEEND